MPDETASNSNTFERLFDEAAAPTLSTDLECKHCSRTTRRICPTCKGPYCDDHASLLDPNCCSLCLNESAAELKELPLRDIDGVTHTGRVLTPAPTATYFQPHFGTLAKSIAEMSMYELEGHIDHYKELVKQAEKTLDFRRVVLGASQIEHVQRLEAERRRLRTDRTKYPVHTVTVDKTTGKAVRSTVSTDKIMEAMRLIEEMRKQKAKL